MPIFCRCVRPKIVAYQENLQELKRLKHTIEQWKKKSEALEAKSDAQEQKIKELESQVAQLKEQLASKICANCSENGLTEMMSSTSMQENRSESQVIMKSL